jgi:hypothetical protein
VENSVGKRLMEWIEENVWEVLNGNKQGDEIVIDYGIVNEETWERVEEFRIGERVEFPVGNKYKRNEPRRKGKRRSKGGAEEGDNKSMR